MVLAYARAHHAPFGRLSETAGAIGQAACQAAHAVLAVRGEWVTNEKTLVTRAGLRAVDSILADLGPEPETLIAAVDEAHTLLESAARPR